MTTNNVDENCGQSDVAAPIAGVSLSANGTQVASRRRDEDNVYIDGSEGPSFSNIAGKFLSIRVSGHFCDPHFHDTYSIALVRRGSAECVIGDRTYAVAPGDVMLIHPYEVACGGNDDDSFLYDVIYPSCGLVNDIMGTADTEDNYPTFREPIIGRCDRSDALFDAVDLYASSAQASASDAPIERALKDLLCSRDVSQPEIESSKSATEAIVRACELIQNQHAGAVQLASIAEEVGLSRYYFIRLFQKYTKLTPSEYLRQVRLAHARRIILGGAGLADAAAIAGFSDQAHMTRLFNRTFGFTPGQLMRGIQS